jgi:hypothetical protein
MVSCGATTRWTKLRPHGAGCTRRGSLTAEIPAQAGSRADGDAGAQPEQHNPSAGMPRTMIIASYGPELEVKLDGMILRYWMYYSLLYQLNEPLTILGCCRFVFFWKERGSGMLLSFL